MINQEQALAREQHMANKVPSVVIIKDFDGYFESMVRAWIQQKEGPFKHETIEVNLGPYRSSAVSYVF